MKNCSNKNCNQINPQPLDNFYSHKGMNDGRASQCGDCCREHNKKRYKEDPDYTRKRRANWIYTQHKKNSCEQCGFVALHKCQLDVDHIDGNHNNNELSNLRTLCANCHRLKTQINKEFGPKKRKWN